MMTCLRKAQGKGSEHLFNDQSLFILETKMTGRAALLFSLLLVVGITRVQGDCKMHDAYWKKEKGPTVTQPSRHDATKVQVSWGNIIENARCVDEFVLHVWQTGSDENRALRITGIPKNTRAKIVEVVPCVSYSFRVSIVERDWTHTDKKATATAVYETTAVPSMRSLDRDNFYVGYKYNRQQKMHDLSKAIVGMNKRAVYNVNCVKEIKITGEIINGRQYDDNEARKGVEAQKKLEKASMEDNGRRRSNWRSGFLFRQRQEVMRPNGQLEHGYNPNWRQQSETDHLHHRDRPGRSSGRRPLRPPGSLNNLEAVLRPPFTNTTLISTQMDIRACEPHRFRIQIIGPGNREVGDRKKLYLPQLRDLSDYRPPRLDALFRISNMGEIRLNDNMGVPGACLNDFFKAMDKRLESTEKAMAETEQRVEDAWEHADNVHELLDRHKQNELNNFGCQCNSTYIFLNVSDASHHERFRDKLGVYMFRGMHQKRPYYQRVANESLWLKLRHHQDTIVGNDGRREQRHRDESQIHSVQDDDETEDLDWNRHHWPGFKSDGHYGSDQNLEPGVVYFDDGKWFVAKHLDGDGKTFRLKQDVKCAPDQSRRKWEYSGTLVWKDVDTLKWVCAN